MIRYIVSDMDGTLFYQHGKTVFDLSEENQIGIQLANQNGIKLCVASGRMIDYGKRICKWYQIEDCCAGFNGAVIYDHGQITAQYQISFHEIKRLFQCLELYRNQIRNIQFQSLDSIRYFDDLTSDYAQKYIKDYEKVGIAPVAKQTITDIIKQSMDIPVGKISIIVNDQIEELLIALKQELCDLTVVQSGQQLIEIVNGRVDKGTFCEYLLRTRHLSKDEIAVIGDAPNDLGMCQYSHHIFAMNSGSDIMKQAAHYVVENVGECITKCIEINRREERK
ncbi:MAG: HAD-IIB family hydrolase [Erysipelotrichaceae bacterium]|nr:HAD-IIB family hydrolase [Erysipelotrichaceae bacterium]